MEFEKSTKHQLIVSMPENIQSRLKRIGYLEVWDQLLMSSGQKGWDEDTPVSPESVIDLIDSFMHGVVDRKPYTVPSYDEARPAIGELVREYFPGNDTSLSQADLVRKFILVLKGQEKYFKSQQQNKELLNIIESR